MDLLAWSQAWPGAPAGRGNFDSSCLRFEGVTTASGNKTQDLLDSLVTFLAEPAVAVTPLLSEMEFEADSLKDECAHILKLCVSRAAYEDSAQTLRQASFGSTALSALCKAGLLLQVADKEFQLTESAVRSSEKQNCCLDLADNLVVLSNLHWCHESCVSVCVCTCLSPEAHNLRVHFVLSQPHNVYAARADVEAGRAIAGVSSAVAVTSFLNPTLPTARFATCMIRHSDRHSVTRMGLYFPASGC